MPRPDAPSGPPLRVERADLWVAAAFALLASATLVVDRPSDARAVPDLAAAAPAACGPDAAAIVVRPAPGTETAVVRIDVCEAGTLGVDVRASAPGGAVMVARRVDDGASGAALDGDPWRVAERDEWRRVVAAGDVWVVGRVGGEAEARAWIAATSFEPSR